MRPEAEPADDEVDPVMIPDKDVTRQIGNLMPELSDPTRRL